MDAATKTLRPPGSISAPGGMLLAPASAPRLPPVLSSSEILELSRVDAVVSLQRWWKHRRRHNHKRIAELSEQLVAYAQSLIHKKRQARIRAKIRDIVLHVVFLVVYTVSSHHGYANDHLYRLVHATTREYRDRCFDALGSRTYETISSPEDVFAWLRGPFLSSTYPVSSPSASTATDAEVFLTNRVVGAVRIGQLRVGRTNCTKRLATYAPAALTDEINKQHSLNCYGSSLGDFSPDEESTDPFGGSLFLFEGLNGTSTTTERSEYLSSMKATNAKTLPPPAFSILLPRANKTHAAEVIQSLENNGYLDLQTRALMIDVNLFNIMLQYTIALRFLVEFPSSGGAVATVHVSTAPLTESFVVSADDVWWTLCNVTVLIFYAYFLLSEIAVQSNRRRRRLALPSSSGRALRWSSRNGSMLRVLSLILYFVVWLMRLFTRLKAPTSFPLFTSTSYVRLRPFAEAFHLSQYLLGLNTCICWWILILLLRVVTHVDTFVRTIEFAAPRLLTLIVCLAILLYGYASAFLVVAGVESSQFRSIPQAMATLLLLVVGSSSTSTISHYSTMELVLFACFLVLNIFIVSNFFLVVVYDSYRQALDFADQLRNSHSQFNLPLETFNYCREVVEQIVEWTKHFAHRLAPARKLPLPDKLKRFSVVHAVSNSAVVTKSTGLFAGKAGELTRFGDRIVRNVAAGLGDSEWDLLIERDQRKKIEGIDGANTRGLYSRRRRADNGGNDQTAKLFSGMLLQLAIQNEALQRSVDELRRDLKQQLSAKEDVFSSGGTSTSTSRKASRMESNPQARSRMLALNRPENEETDDDDDDVVGENEEVHVMDSPGELTAIQSIS